MLERLWRKGNALVLLVGMQIDIALWKMIWSFLIKLGIKSPYDPAIPLLGIYPEETKIEYDTCIPLFIAALFTIARIWKKSRCQSTDEGKEVLVHIYNGILLS